MRQFAIKKTVVMPAVSVMAVILNGRHMQTVPMQVSYATYATYATFINC